MSLIQLYKNARANLKSVSRRQINNKVFMKRALKKLTEINKFVLH